MAKVNLNIFRLTSATYIIVLSLNREDTGLFSKHVGYQKLMEAIIKIPRMMK